MTIHRILLVDDEVALAQAMADILEMHGFLVTVAHNGVQALEKALPQTSAEPHVKFDLIISDLDMPGMDGISLIKTIRGFDKMIPVLVITGYGSKKSITELLRLGVIDCIDKPVTSDVVIRRIKEIEEELTVRNRRMLAEVEMIEQHCSQYQKRLAVAYQYDILGRLASGVVHDIANTVQAVIGYLDLARQSLEGGELASTDQQFARASVAAEIARNLTLQFQAFSRNDEQEMTSLSIRDVVMRSIALSKTTLAKTGVYVDFDDSHPDIRVSGNSTMLQVALFNLYLNARDAMPNGGSISVKTSREESHVDDDSTKSWCVIKVTDGGTGMLPEIQNRIFEPFFTTKGTQGNGLGLPNVLSAIIKHQGTIGVESAVGKGTSFTLRIPQES